MILAIVFLFSSSVEAAGFYHPADTAKESELYQRSAEVAGTKAASLEQKAQGIATALNQYEEAMDLLGDVGDHRIYFGDSRKAFNRQFAVASAFVHTMLEDFDAEFSRSMETALRKHSGSEVCAATRPVGGRALPGIRTRMEPNPDCKGTNLNAVLAKAMDNDPKLQTSIKEILSLSWPQVEQPQTAQNPVGGGTIWLPTLSVFQRLVPGGLAEIRKNDQMRRAEQFAMEFEGLSDAEKQEALKQSREITQATQAERAQFAAPILLAVDTINAKNEKKGLPTYAWCPTPQLLGGCSGTAASRTQIDALLQDKRVQKALP